MLRKINSQKVNWKLINYRTVSNLITAEFLHDLYNRHSYEVNSVRFRNTLCILKDFDFRSYAPQREWELLEIELGERFLERDPVLIAELNLYIHKDKKRLREYLNGFPSSLDNISPKKAYQMLVHLHFLALGEIYGINLVQIEHAISWAIAKHLQGHGEDFSSLPSFNWESQQKKMDKSILLGSLRMTEKSESFDSIVKELVKDFGHFKNAYGTGVECQKDIESQLLELMKQPSDERLIRYRSMDLISDQSESNDYKDLFNLASQVGELRDKNKLLMGKVSSVRKKLLEHIATSLEINPADFRWYSLIEIGDLVRRSVYLSSDDIKERKKLVIFKREEGFCLGSQTEDIHRSFLGNKKSSSSASTIEGIIACRGKVQGIARLVYTSADCDSVNPGDIMIAYGTDFDLLSGISRAAGIVTEEGGILSHASIVSRELHKPCLIGALGAMSIVNNGDFVELDCQKGILSIMNENPAFESFEIQTLDKIDPSQFSNKIINLHHLKKWGYNVLPGLCIHSTQSFEKGFFQILKSQIRHHLKTDKVIIRQSTGWEDQNDKSYAGLSCSRVASSDLQDLEKTFTDAMNRQPHFLIYDEAISDSKVDLLIQPFLDFECGGVTFLQSDLLGHKYAIVEGSDRGPYHAVNGKPTFRFSCKIDDLIKQPPQEFPQHISHSIDIALQISSLLEYDIDIEWGFYQNEFWILQARPVTVPCVL